MYQINTIYCSTGYVVREKEESRLIATLGERIQEEQRHRVYGDEVFGVFSILSLSIYRMRCPLLSKVAYRNQKLERD